MNIAVKGSSQRSAELSQVLSSVGLGFTRLESTKNIHTQSYDVIFDLDFDDDNSGLEDYVQLKPETQLLLSSVKIQLESVLPESLWSQVLGINALSTFLNRPYLECCKLTEGRDLTFVKELGWKGSLESASRVGLASARVVLMIINEAYFTLQEGTAGKKDIDLGMKLGTAYPLGPFEWSEKIGIKDVFEVLSAMYNDTKDDRYKICSLMKTDYLRSQKNA